MIVQLLGEGVPQAQQHIEAVVGPDVLVEFLVLGQLGQEDGCILSYNFRLLFDNIDQVQDHGLELLDALGESADESGGAGAGIDERWPILLSIMLRFVETVFEELSDLYNVRVEGLHRELVLIQTGIFEVWQLGQGVQGPQGVQLEVTLPELPVEVENGLEDSVLLRQHLLCCFLIAEDLAVEVEDPIKHLTLLGIGRLENSYKSLHVI